MCMGVPVLSPQGSPAVLGVLGYPVLTPPFCLAVCILCLLPALPTWPWDPPGPPGWVSLPWGHCLGMGGGHAEPPHRCQHCMGQVLGWGSSQPFRAPQAPRGPWGPTECGVPWGSPWLHSHSPLGKSWSSWRELWGDPQNSGHILLLSRAWPCCPHPQGCVPLPLILWGSPSHGVPCPAGVPSPRGAAGAGRTF